MGKLQIKQQNLFQHFLIVVNSKIAWFKKIGLSPYIKLPVVENNIVIIHPLDGDPQNWQGFDYDKIFIDAQYDLETAEGQRVKGVIWRRNISWPNAEIVHKEFDQENFLNLVVEGS